MSEIERLLYEKECPFTGNCTLKCELEEERGKRVILEAHLEEYKNDFANILHQVTESFALKHYVERLNKLTELEGIYLIKRDDILDIWTIITKSNLEIEETIANVQCELYRIYENLNFDFMVFPLENNIERLIPDDAIKLFPNEV